MKMTTIIFWLIVAASASTALGRWDGYAPVADAQATFRVIDTEGVPVANALIKHCFHNNRTPDKERLVEKYTGTNGCVVFEGETSGGLTYRVQKDGYYLSDGKYTEWQEKWTPPDSPNIKKGCWQPWNPTFDVVLKKIKNPVPMLSSGRLQPELPQTNTFVGFDLELKDWVAPYGKGVHDDFRFQIKRRFISRDDYDAELTLAVTNSLDGVQGFLADTTKGSGEGVSR